MRIVLPLVFVAALLAGCSNQPSNIDMPPADKREKESKVVVPPLNSSESK